MVDPLQIHLESEGGFTVSGENNGGNREEKQLQEGLQNKKFFKLNNYRKLLCKARANAPAWLH